MSVSYDKLWKILIDKKMNRTELKDSSGISFNVLAKMGKNEFVSMEKQNNQTTTSNFPCNFNFAVSNMNRCNQGIYHG